ncbi:glycosyl transferase [Candidatus Roizmanbacteria bacterium RIFOXYB2_FULL_41_10]|uniref:Glycosyl transferase n=1 Tax=Candidatus Roizmanbacteria bacterium RIFOXYA1_FULL_41_12 TaxID=1802082 RepID=A0A1F7KAA5_9BACT|nr:MAG: glycosyl transferase [Candidatus Roizmanbacteria bacterium RIFOXYA1_FULL_41_12]OGK67585.1 MAG: glycosyl transferase [Candidatus Roizmanbacteria bacterium RIFOXYB1_FULL_41_27]OGK68397.1 MAG: glycosyl transferase [Candidatus Roizmanbacteria bacterium RIFOXYA2_FULL_41_8]OGK70990.1 MAG: glycosyl transferase [Candidatus Roizmanbacteria bacterium RIFOXYB2_FULL_41_10]OGK71236.1 MAG: glycosyl transferase [Candidatus Roizmanbacteria bacterium RIFOXYC1_FULL_41_16]OGK74641.1 MAG: glycosyl transfe
MMQYSLILPIFNEQENIETLYSRIDKVMKQIDRSYEIIFINDGSTDKSQVILTALAKKNKAVKVINFSRNFGHQIAVTAGLNHSSGEVVAILDADLQDPPEVLPSFFKKLSEGYDVVYAIRRHRKESIPKRIMYYLFYRLLRLVANISIPLDSGDFCVMSRRVVLLLKNLPERNRFIRGLRSWVGFRQTGLTYERQSRMAGKSKYTLAKMFKLAFDGIFSFSYIPLQLLTWGGFIFLALAFFGIILTLYAKLFTDIFIPRGFPTTIIVILFIGGMNMFSLGIIGEYIGRIYDEIKQRQLYIVESKLNF